jgi:hypothetical protein
MGGIGERAPPEPAPPLDQPVSGCPATYKDWNREPTHPRLEWSKRPDAGWWLFADVGPGQLNSHGVFVVWQSGDGAKASSVLFVGRGSLRDEFARCNRDPIFRLERLYVTWATVNDARMLDSVAAYLYQRLQPLWGEAVFAPSTPVNLAFPA